MTAKRYTAEIIEASTYEELLAAESDLIREGSEATFLFGAKLARDSFVRAYRIEHSGQPTSDGAA